MIKCSAKKASLDEEIKTYLAEQCTSKKSNPISYWQERKKEYSGLFAMSKKFLSVPATSTPSERAFSGGRLICHYTRGSLSPQALTALMCSNSWLKNGLWDEN